MARLEVTWALDGQVGGWVGGCYPKPKGDARKGGPPGWGHVSTPVGPTETPASTNNASRLLRIILLMYIYQMSALLYILLRTILYINVYYYTLTLSLFSDKKFTFKSFSNLLPSTSCSFIVVSLVSLFKKEMLLLNRLPLFSSSSPLMFNPSHWKNPPLPPPLIS